MTVGDADIAAVGGLLADRGRCRMLFALGDGRALPASRLAAEAGVSASTASSHLRRLLEGGLVLVEPHGRHRYYRLAGPEVARLLESMAQLAPTEPVLSLRQGTRAAALRSARTCYDHLAGRLGVDLMAALIARGHLTGGDGSYDASVQTGDHPSAFGRDLDYRLTAAGRDFMAQLGVAPAPVRYCVDWTEQRHHLAGPLGRSLLRRLLELRWVERSPTSRALRVLDPDALEHAFSAGGPGHVRTDAPASARTADRRGCTG